jgi:non-specific serine/threonine protein kinase
MMLGMFGSRMMMIGHDPETAQAYVEQGISSLKESGNRWGHTMILMSMAMVAKYRGRFDEARSSFQASLPIFRDMGDRHRVNMVQSELAHMERAESHYEIASQMYLETIPEWQRLGHRAAVAHQLECLAFIAKVHEKGERAATLFGAAEALREQIEIQMTVMERAEYDREVMDLRSGMDEQVFSLSWAKGRAMTMEEAISFALEES